MNLLWLLQTNGPYLQRWQTALKTVGSHYEICLLGQYPQTPKRTIGIGTTDLIKTWPADLTPGIWFHPENFRPSTWSQKLGSQFLNASGQTLPLKEFLRTPPPTPLFIRPDADLKAFSGSVVDAAGWLKFKTAVEDQTWPLSMNLPIFIAPRQPLTQEWRVFMARGQVLGGSRYRVRTMLSLQAGLPEEVKTFVSEVAQTWEPAPVYVIDIAETTTGLKVLEYNCFNAAGVYATDLTQVITGIEQLLKEEKI